MTKNKEETQQSTSNQELDKELEKYEQKEFASLLKQVDTEYELAWWYMKPKIDEWAVRLKLYNNQKREATAVGDPLLFTVHQTILAALYSDRLSVSFLGRESGDSEVAENLDNLASFDYDEMEKDVLDYQWDWDASFFGRGLLLAMEFSRELKCPLPEVIDMMTWLRDPRATSVNGDRKGRGAMRFGGREIRLTAKEMKDSGVYFDYEKFKSDGVDPQSLVDQNIQARATAQGLADVSKWKALDGENKDHRILEWFTHWNGKKVLVGLAKDRTKVVRYTELKSDYWPIVDRAIYPIAHDWDGVSIPDLVEDKQRGRAIVQNLALEGIKIGLNPVYLYNTLKIKNRGNLNVEFNKHIPVDGDPTNAIVPVQKQAVKQEVQWILDVLDASAQRATATPDVRQGISPSEKRTATETNLIAASVDTRYSLSAKIFGWSEKRFWRIGWYDLYKAHFKDKIDEKIIRISGAMGSKWRTLTRENIIANTDPDIKIESKVVSDAQKFNELQQYRLFIKDVMATNPQSANVMSALRQIGRLSGLKKDEVEQVLPPTIDEMNSEAENMKLDEEKAVMVNVYDDDFVHLEVHNRAADTPQKTAHINSHRNALMLKRVKPEFDLTRGNKPPEPEAVKSEPVMFANSGVSAGSGRKLPALSAE